MFPNSLYPPRHWQVDDNVSLMRTINVASIYRLITRYTIYYYEKTIRLIWFSVWFCNSATFWDSPKEICYGPLWKKGCSFTSINSNCIWSFDNGKELHTTFLKASRHLTHISEIFVSYACMFVGEIFFYIWLRFVYPPASFVLYVAPSFNNNIGWNKSKRRRKASYLSKFCQGMLRNDAT